MKLHSVTCHNGISKALCEAGFAVVAASASSLLDVANTLGRPRPSRPHRGPVDRLRATEAALAPPRSLSARYGDGPFPFHSDTAHWPVPARYTLLALANETTERTATLLLPWSALVLDLSRDLLETEPFAVRTSSNSFLTTIRDAAHRWYRYDSTCMSACTRAGRQAAESIEARMATAIAHVHYWALGTVLVIDNWNVLHARPAGASPSRCVLRVLVEA